MWAIVLLSEDSVPSCLCALRRDALKHAMDTIFSSMTAKWPTVFVAHNGAQYHLPLLKEELARFSVSPIPEDDYWWWIDTLLLGDFIGGDELREEAV